MTISDEISIIANKLANEGKVPSVALIKSQLNQAIPLPQIISALKNWHHEPKFIQAQHQEITTKTSTEAKPNNIEISLLISNALAPLQQEITELKQQLKQLLDYQKDS
jgi:antitoxin component of RelBE/YafQ-DinJ toxin-antitoxin module